MDETPAGAGFGQAALAGVRRGRISTSTLDSAPQGTLVQFVIRFLAPEPVPIKVFDEPAWATPPHAEMPRRARRAGVESAQVRLDCEIDPRRNGRLRACVVVSEDPPGHDFGHAALRATRNAVMLPGPLINAAPDAHAVFTVEFTRP